MNNTKFKKVSIEEVASKEASKKIKQAPTPIPTVANQEKVGYTKPKSEFDNKDINAHPVLKKLKSKLGLKPLELHTVSIMADGDKFDFSLSEYSEELVLYCASEYRRAIMTNGETSAMKRFDILRLGCSLVAIDNAPVYEIFDVDIELSEMDRITKNPYDLSDRLRRECSKIFCKMVLHEFRGFISELENFFIEKIVNAIDIKAFDSLKEGQNIYICEVPNCPFVHKDKPMLNDKGEEIPYLCTIHAVPLKKSLTLNERSNLPLA